MNHPGPYAGDPQNPAGNWQNPAPNPYGPTQMAPMPGYGPPRRGRSVGVLIAVLALACVMAVAVAGVVIWKQTSDSDEPRATPIPGQLTAEYPDAPEQGWAITPQQVGADRFVSVLPSQSQYLRPGFIRDDTTVVTMAESQGSSVRSLIGVDAESGEHWVSPAQVRGCADRIVDRVVACSSGESVYFIDVRNGGILDEVVLDGQGSGPLAFNGERAYVFGTDSGGGRSVVQVKRDGLGWRQSYPDVEFLGSGDASVTTATDSLVATASGSVLVVSALDGRVFVNAPGTASIYTLPDGSMVVDTGVDSAGSGAVQLVRPDGTVTAVSGKHVAGPIAVTPGSEGSVIVDGRLVDLNGEQFLWAAGVVDGSSAPQLPLLTEREAIMVDSADGRVFSVGADSGVERWSVPGVWTYGGEPGVTDGKHFVYASDENTVSAVDLDTGVGRWSIPVRVADADSMDPVPRVMAVGSTLLVGGASSIAGYAATGGPASAPGAARPSSDENSGSGSGDGQDRYVTKCGSSPVFEPQQFSTDGTGLVVSMKVTATCPTGDVLSAPNTRITIADGGGATVASGSFDFSRSAVALPPGRGADQEQSATVELTYPPGSFLRLPDTLGAAGGSPSGNTYLVECEEIGGPGAVTEAAAPAAGGAGARAVAGAPLFPTTISIDASTADALRLQASSDRGFILSNLNNRWVAQLSSKQPGLVADGRQWSNQAILDEFLALRLRFRDVRLMWSGEWSVFNERDWWVTVAAATFDGPDQANAWCAAAGLDRDHCFAKLVSTTAPPEGSTRYQR